MDEKRRAYLKQKQERFQAGLKEAKKQRQLLAFISSLKKKGIESITIASMDFPAAKIFRDTWRYEPEVPVFKSFNFRQGDSASQVMKFLRDWVTHKSISSLLITSDYLVSPADWLQLSTIDFVSNLEVLYTDLNLEHNILLDPPSREFLSLSEFESELNIYRGHIKDGKILYSN